MVLASVESRSSTPSIVSGNGTISIHHNKMTYFLGISDEFPVEEFLDKDEEGDLRPRVPSDVVVPSCRLSGGRNRSRERFDSIVN